MNVHAETRDGIAMMHVTGRIDSTTAAAFEHALMSAIDGGASRLAIDFSGVDYISSAGLRVLLVAGKKVRMSPDGKLVLCCLREQIREVFEISGFLAIFPVTDNADKAVKEFR